MRQPVHETGATPLEREAGVDEATARRLLTDDEPFEAVDLPDPAALARRVDNAIARCTVLDPAVGSGAFPLGMLTEFVRLRRLAHRAIAHREPTPGELWDWKLHAVERSLYGVDINPGAVELCRLRLWLALLVEEETHHVHPLPNLEYRVICADSLTDFLGGYEVQRTRSGPLSFGLGLPDTHRIVELRERYFEESRPAAKAELRTQLGEAEDAVVEQVFTEALENARLQRSARQAAVQRLGESATRGVAELRAAYGSRDRRFPLFVPAFHAPEIVEPDGWSVVIMNPPYVGRKEVAQRLEPHRIRDLELHYGRTFDLMIHFAVRALELVRPGGVVSMIFNDSIFNSEDADDLRRRLLGGDDVSLRTVARSRCFEGKAVNGGVIVAVAAGEARDAVRWVENHGRPTSDLAGASVTAAIAEGPTPVGESELWVSLRSSYEVLPHRPLFRPSRPARDLLTAYERCARWREFGRYQAPTGGARQPDWKLLSDTRALDIWKRNAALVGFYERLRGGVDFILLGLVVEGGQGLVTADDRRYLGAIDGTPDAEQARENARHYAELVRARPGPRAALEAALATNADLERALLAVAERYRPRELGWPRSGLIRVVDAAHVWRTRLTEREVQRGLTGEITWVPFEKGDDSGDDGGAARWSRRNPLVIDWSEEAVALLRRRARQTASYRKPRLQNQDLWGQGGITWNRVASYVRARVMDPGAIFSDKAPLVRPTVGWLTVPSLAAVLNAPVIDFLVRTFLGSRMMVELGDIRAVPVPVLSDSQSRTLDELGTRAIEAKAARDDGRPDDLEGIESEIDEYVRDLYRIDRNADLWVVR